MKRPSKTKTEMQTAVTGSRAPTMAVGVEPAFWMPMLSIVIAMMVGTMATIQIQPKAVQLGMGMMRLSGTQKE